jgi:hypothetical protein
LDQAGNSRNGCPDNKKREQGSRTPNMVIYEAKYSREEKKVKEKF